jgi:hypothetical protein
MTSQASWIFAIVSSVGALGSGCGPTDVHCDTRKLVDDQDEGSSDLVHAEEAGSLEVSGSTLSTAQDFTLRIEGLSKIGFTRVGEGDSSVSVLFETQYLESVPPGSESPSLTHTLIIDGGLQTSGTGTFGTTTRLEVPIFGCERRTDLGRDASCCPAGEEICELLMSVATSREDLLFPATVTSYAVEANVELQACIEEPAFEVRLIREGEN